MKLERISISNFKGIRSQSFEPSKFSCLVGENNAGKSTVMQAIVYALNRATQLPSSVQELEEIHSELGKLTDCVDIKLGEAHTVAMDAKRRLLLEDEESKGYQTSQWKALGHDFSDEQVRALFSTILD